MRQAPAERVLGAENVPLSLLVGKSREHAEKHI
jgi:hypothetical protein